MVDETTQGESAAEGKPQPVTEPQPQPKRASRKKRDKATTLKKREETTARREQAERDRKKALTEVVNKIGANIPDTIWTGKVFLLRDDLPSPEGRTGHQVQVRYVIPPQEDVADMAAAVQATIKAARKQASAQPGPAIRPGDVLMIGANETATCFLYNGKELSTLTKHGAAEYVRQWESAHGIDRLRRLNEEELEYAYPRYESPSDYTLVPWVAKGKDQKWAILVRQTLERMGTTYPYIRYNVANAGLSHDEALTLLAHYQRRELWDWVQLHSSVKIAIEEGEEPPAKRLAAKKRRDAKAAGAAKTAKKRPMRKRNGTALKTEEPPAEEHHEEAAADSAAEE